MTNKPLSNKNLFRKGDDSDDENEDTVEGMMEESSIHGGGLGGRSLASFRDETMKSKHATNNHNSGSGSGSNLAERETRLVNRSKWIVYVVILLSAAVAGTVTFFYMKGEERIWYEDEFEEFAEEVFESTKVNLEKLDQAVLTMAELWTTHAGDHDHVSPETDHEQYPNVTLPNFGVVSENLNNLGNAKGIAVAPYVRSNEKRGWEAYAYKHQGWITEDLRTASNVLHRHGDDHHASGDAEVLQQQDPGTIRTTIYGSRPEADSHLPVWQIYPTPTDAYESPIMMDLQGLDWFHSSWNSLFEGKEGHVFTPIVNLDPILSYQDFDDNSDESGDEDSHDYDRRTLAEQEEGEKKSPQSAILEPIYDDFDTANAQIVGVAIAFVEWKDLFSGLLEDEAEGMILDVEYTCQGAEQKSKRYAFRTTANEDVVYIGEDFQHDPKYEYLSQRKAVTGESSEEEDSSDSDDRRVLQEDETKEEEEEEASSDDDDDNEETSCDYYVSIHITDEFVENWQRSDVVVFPIIVCSIFIFTGLVFLFYDLLVQNRNRKVVQTAARSAAIVTSLFPKKVAEQIMMEETAHEQQSSSKYTSKSSTIQAFKAISAPNQDEVFTVTKKPIADLFKDVTIMFADIAGFTAWSSMREPVQVFKLLETIFNAFDVIADRRNVFKVETVGDCYVAVAGLPDPRKDHAVVMARFARDCLIETGILTKKLELELGPDTSDLNMRIGLHSGPVTAGVLRGQRARFQLFGDTMNRASRIETSGRVGRIHMSSETADLIIASGKSHWVSEREDVVNLKGIGHVSTFWLNIRSEGSTGTEGFAETVSCTSAGSTNNQSKLQDLGSGHITMDDCEENKKTTNLVSWHTEILSVFLRKIIALRTTTVTNNNNLVQTGSEAIETAIFNEQTLRAAESQAVFGRASPSTLIAFPVIEGLVDESTVDLDEKVIIQLTNFVRAIAGAYNPNPFHNFQHASHVVMSVTKLLNHLESSSEICVDDPMTQFAVILTALVHDVDHPGVPNTQLVAEGHSLSKLYKSSIAERNSLDVTWKLLRQDCFYDLRRAIYQTPAEFEYFRQLMVHSVLVTDLMDTGLQSERKQRWKDVFERGDPEMMEERDDERHEDLVNKHKMALLEHVIQTSDVAHTMQHWNVYQQWNKCLYEELSQAYQSNRASKDPADFWYDGEIGFFEAYIIPLAQRLKNCPAFDASGQELLHYAKSNRKEWEVKGKDVLDQWR